MRSTILAAAVAFVVGGIATGAVLSHAQPVPPPAPQGDQAGAPQQHWAGGWRMHRGPQGGQWHRGFNRERPFALVYRQHDRQLTPADVQKIAEGFLLWNGNHTWKVANVAARPDGAIGFDMTTPDGSVIAQFTMDPHSGRIHRIG
ncbi:MAG TPA: hypothetical protein VFG12_01205 [Rhodopila sp.]|jgi:hypothetical protein|nr:hypothetical protein [Rhodopila sp.]